MTVECYGSARKCWCIMLAIIRHTTYDHMPSICYMENHQDQYELYIFHNFKIMVITITIRNYLFRQNRTRYIKTIDNYSNNTNIKHYNARAKEVALDMAASIQPGAPNSAKFRGGCRGPSKIRQRGGCNNFLLFTR